ncbi:Ig-like domain-containing protein [Vibrio taketomensis]|uniref:Ig-like domain-containing protein n=1 Tax=Vibrio taketomensis TaxID=2572923 RepID=UPI001389E19E|nr:cadherin-like domain-containing protein [Vibrio taketomensis]
MGIGNLFTLVNAVIGQSIVIGIDGEVRILKLGEPVLPGELIIDVPGQEIADGQPYIQQVTQSGDIEDVTQQVSDIIAAIEEGADPTLADPDLAPAAGGLQGSSLGLSGTVDRDGSESQPETQFVTSATNQLNLSSTQSLTLLESYRFLFSEPSLPVGPELGLPPIAQNDPVGFSLTLGDMSLGADVGAGWDIEGATISASFKGNEADWQENYEGLLGVVNTGAIGGADRQIEYDRTTQTSEKLSIKFDQAATEGRFVVSNLYAAEGKVIDSNNQSNEVGVWVAYLNGVVAASGSFESSTAYSGEKFVVEIDTNGNAFDEIVFMANEYSLGLQGDSGADSSDYFIAGIEVSSPGFYAGNQGEVLRIPISEILNNDSDPEGSILTLSELLGTASQGSAVINGGFIEFTPNADFSGTTQLQYQITDEDGQTDTAVINIIINELPADAKATSVTMLDSDVLEGDDLIYTVNLDTPTLTETRYDFSFDFLNGANDNDVDLEGITFTNGVSIQNGQLVVPEGVGKFDVMLPTRIDLESDSGEQVLLTVSNLDDSGQLLSSVSATGTILDYSTALIDVSYSLEQGDMSQAGSGNQGWDKVDLEGQFLDAEVPIYHNTETGLIGVDNGPEGGGPLKQIQYDRESGQSEKLVIKFDTPATRGIFAVSNLYKNEGEGENNHESGSWIAKLNGVAVASGEFNAGDNDITSHQGQFEIDTNGLAFDEIVFSANEYTQGLNGDNERDSSDYFIEGIQVEASNQFSILSTTDAQSPSVLAISESHIFKDLDTSNRYQLSEAMLVNQKAGSVTIENGQLVFKAESGFIGETSIEFKVVDQNANIYVGVIAVTVVESPPESIVESITANEIAVAESEAMSFSILLDKVTLSETQYDFVLRSSSDTLDQDVDISSISFTNGVMHSINSSRTGVFTVPEGVSSFDVYIPTKNDFSDDPLRLIDISIEGVHASSYLSEDITILENNNVSNNNEVVFAVTGNETHALGGNDILISSLGDDILFGGDGEDIFKWLDDKTVNDQRDTIFDFVLGEDKIDIADLLSEDTGLEALLASIDTVKVDDSEVHLSLVSKDSANVDIILTNEDSPQFGSVLIGSESALLKIF